MNNKYFDKEKQQKAIEWLEEKWPTEKRSCEICGLNHWTLAADLVMPLPFVEGRLTIGGNSYPHVLITCSNCGNSKNINAVVMGIVEKASSNV